MEELLKSGKKYNTNNVVNSSFYESGNQLQEEKSETFDFNDNSQSVKYSLGNDIAKETEIDQFSSHIVSNYEINDDKTSISENFNSASPAKETYIHNNNPNIFLISLIILLSSISNIYLLSTGNYFSIITPLEISQKIERLNIFRLNQIPYKIGKFGDIPFGKTVLAMLFLQTEDDGSNYWCNYDTTKIPSELNSYSNNDFVI